MASQDIARAAATVASLGNCIATDEAKYVQHMRIAKVAKDKDLAAAHARAAEVHYRHIVNAREAIDRIFDQVR